MAGRTRHTKWRVVENLVGDLERILAGVPGTRVVRRAQLQSISDPETTRDVDVLIEIPLSGRNVVIGVEVKNEKRPIDITVIEQIAAKFSDLQIDRCCVVSTSGFTEPAIKRAKKERVEVRTLREVLGTEAVPGRPTFTPSTRGWRAETIQFDLPTAAFSQDIISKIQETLSDPDFNKLQIKLTDGRVTTLAQALMSPCRHLAGFHGMVVPDEMTVSGDFSPADFGWSSLVLLDGSEVPVPATIHGVWKGDRLTVYPFEGRSWVLDFMGIRIETAVWETPSGAHQSTAVSGLRSDGSLILGMTIGPAFPPEVAVEDTI